jgi:hypothetical protein
MLTEERQNNRRKTSSNVLCLQKNFCSIEINKQQEIAAAAPQLGVPKGTTLNVPRK